MGGAELMPENPLAHEAPIVIGLHIIGSSAFFTRRTAVSTNSSASQKPSQELRSHCRGWWSSVITGLVMTHRFVFSSELRELLYWVRMVVGTAMLADCLWHYRDS